MVAQAAQAADSVIGGTFHEKSCSATLLAVLTVALIHDTLRDNEIERLSAAC